VIESGRSAPGIATISSDPRRAISAIPTPRSVTLMIDRLARADAASRYWLAWARLPRSFGHEVKLIAPQLVKPYVKRGKNDAADAEVLCDEGVVRTLSRLKPASRPTPSRAAASTPQKLSCPDAHRYHRLAREEPGNGSLADTGSGTLKISSHVEQGCIDHRRNGAGWFVPSRAAARKGLYRSSYKAPFILVQHGAHRSSGNDGLGTGEAAGDPSPVKSWTPQMLGSRDPRRRHSCRLPESLIVFWNNPESSVQRGAG
jgi:hypothetical protein